MTTYFDNKTREINSFNDAEFGDAAFLEGLAGVERIVASDVSLCVGDREFPEEFREKAMEIIALWATFKGESGLAPRQEAVEMARVGRNSTMIDSLHSLFHKVAAARIECRYGLLSDDPWGTLKRRTVWERERFGEGVLDSPVVTERGA